MEKRRRQNFDGWNSKKKEISEHENPFFRVGEVWMTSVGENIGSESCGKGEDFLRPILILRVWNDKFFMGIPLTSKEKKNKFHCSIGTIGEIESFAMLSQSKQVDGKRLVFCMGRISKETLLEVKEKLFQLIE